MKTPTHGRAALVALAVLVLAGLSWAGTAFTENYAEIHKPSKTSTETGYSPTFLDGTQASGVDFVGLDGSDSTTWSRTAAMTGRTLTLVGDGTLEIQTRLSAAGATCAIAVCRRARDGTLMGPTAGTAAIQTSTAGSGATAIYDGTGYYGDTLVWNVAGWYAAEIRVYDVSGANTVDLLPATIGLAARAAE